MCLYISQPSLSISLYQTVVKRVPPALTLGGPGPLEPLSPSLRAHTLLWFERTQLPRLRQPGYPLPRWLHGFATRRSDCKHTETYTGIHICNRKKKHGASRETSAYAKRPQTHMHTRTIKHT